MSGQAHVTPDQHRGFQGGRADPCGIQAISQHEYVHVAVGCRVTPGAGPEDERQLDLRDTGESLAQYLDGIGEDTDQLADRRPCLGTGLAVIDDASTLSLPRDEAEGD